jgi:hypothetical protein
MRQWENELLERLLNVQEIDLKIRGVELKIAALYDQSMRDDPRLCKLKAEAARVGDSIEAALSQQEMYLNTLEDIRSAIQGLISTRAGAFKLRTRSSTEALKIEEEKLSVLSGETDEQIARLRAELAGVRAAIVERSREVQAAQQAPEAEIRKLRNRSRRLEKQREEAVVGIPQPLLRKYERLRNSRSGIGLTIMRDGVCSVCRMQMPTGIRFRLFRGETLSACPACGRMVARIENPETSRLGLSLLDGSGSRDDYDEDDSEDDGDSEEALTGRLNVVDDEGEAEAGPVRKERSVAQPKAAPKKEPVGRTAPRKAEPKAKAQKAEPKAKAQKAEPKAKAQKAEPKAKAQKAEPKAKAQKAEPKAKAQKVEPKAKAQKAAPKSPPARTRAKSPSAPGKKPPRKR